MLRQGVEALIEWAHGAEVEREGITRARLLCSRASRCERVLGGCTLAERFVDRRAIGIDLVERERAVRVEALDRERAAEDPSYLVKGIGIDMIPDSAEVLTVRQMGYRHAG